MIKRCPSCGLENITPRTICKRCGTSLAAIVPQPSSAVRRAQPRWRGCVMGVVFASLLLLCFLLYRMTLPSAFDHLQQLAHMPLFSATDLPAVRSALLRVVPIGTDESAVTMFLQQAGADVAPDAIVKQRRMMNCAPSYINDSSQRSIVCYIHGERPSLRLLCRDEYVVDFIIDPKTKKVANIKVGDSSAMQCL